MYISLVIIYTKYTGWCQNDFNVRAYNEGMTQRTILIAHTNTGLV
jgi:hypothetical protein